MSSLNECQTRTFKKSEEEGLRQWKELWMLDHTEIGLINQFMRITSPNPVIETLVQHFDDILRKVIKKLIRIKKKQLTVE